MQVQQVSSGVGLIAVFAGIGKCTRKVNVLNVLPKIASITGSLSTEWTSVQTRAIFDNVFIELLVRALSCNHQTIRIGGNLFLLAIFGNVNVKAIPSWEVFEAILAPIVKSSRKVNVLHVFSQISTIFATFTTHSALVPVWLKVIPNNVLIQQPAVAWKKQVLKSS